jgi:DAACS family dicarboxylate/amino acid:cation (Na+ or H+) symporter
MTKATETSPQKNAETTNGGQAAPTPVCGQTGLMDSPGGTTEPPSKQQSESLQARIFWGLGIGAVFGVLSHWLWAGQAWLEVVIKYGAEPLGQIFLRTMTMVVVPMVFASLALGVAGLGDFKKLGRVGFKTLAFFLVTTCVAVIIGLVVVNIIRPGAGLPEELKNRLLATYQQDAQAAMGKTEKAVFGMQTFLAIIPRNPLAAAVQGDMLALIFFSMMFGLALTCLPPHRSKPVLDLLHGIADAMVAIIDFALKLAPYGVAALIFSVTARFGVDLLYKLIWYVFAVLLGLGIHQFVFLSLVMYLFCRMSPLTFYRGAKTILLTAFSTSSSSATLPTTMKITEEELGVPSEICGFVLPLGATVNMNGTALFEGITVLFLAQVFGIHLDLSSQLMVLVLAILSGIGTAGVPGGTIPLMILVLQSVQVPGEGIALILGVDRFLDMCRTTLNVSGDVVTALFVARSEGYPLRPKYEPIPDSRPE